MPQEKKISPIEKLEANQTFCLVMALIHAGLIVFNFNNGEACRFFITQTTSWLAATWIISSIRALNGGK